MRCPSPAEARSIASRRYKKPSEKLFAHNPGLPSRFPLVLAFEDYTAEQLEEILRRELAGGGAETKSAPPPPKLIEPSPQQRAQARKDDLGNLWWPTDPSSGGGWSAQQSSFGYRGGGGGGWTDAYGNKVGGGPGGLYYVGARSNPVLTKEGRAMVRRGEDAWEDIADSSFTQKHYPGSPAPAAPPPKPPVPVRLESDLWGRVACRRLARCAGTEGFANAREVRNLVDRALRRQAQRISAERAEGGNPDIHVLTRDDLLGPKATRAALEASEAYRELMALDGLAEVKQEVGSILSTVLANAELEEKEKPPLELSLNRIFLGNPGTGKTTVARLYARILGDLGLLSKGEVVLKTPSDFVGGALGVSEQQTRAIVEAARGSVLVVDEAYGLYSGGAPGSSSQARVSPQGLLPAGAAPPVQHSAMDPSRRSAEADKPVLLTTLLLLLGRLCSQDPYKAAVIDTLVELIPGNGLADFVVRI